MSSRFPSNPYFKQNVIPADKTGNKHVLGRRRKEQYRQRMSQIRIGPKRAGATLQELLALELGLSRNKAKLLLDQRRIFVNGVRTWMARHVLRSGDIVEIQSCQDASLLPTPFELLYEDPLLLAINKPAGIEATGRGSAEERLRFERNEPELRAIHRLDRDTTGCWLVARNAQSLAKIVDQFARREIRKCYHAIVRGHFSDKERTIRKPMDGLDAVTHIERLSAGKMAAHLLVRIETGRTHQIRRHLSSIGHPVLGDTAYAGSASLSQIERAVPRQMLHASEIRFVHPATGIQITIKSPLPGDFLACLKRFGLE